MIRFHVPPATGNELLYIQQAIENGTLCGDGPFTKKCQQWIEENTGTPKALLTGSGTHALEMAALLCDLKGGDEVILPSFTFSSTANAFVLAGAKLVFVDIRPDTMNIDEKKIEDAITLKTKVICVVHYAGVSCEMDVIMDIAKRHGLLVVEDAAQGVMSFYKGRALGTIGDFGCFSFHDTKNYTMGEGGAILLKDPKNAERAEILREKGTDRSKFLRGQIDKYSWRAYGSSYLPSELSAAYLLAQLDEADKINENRLASWRRYQELLAPLEEQGKVEIPHIPAECQHNAHMFWVKAKDLEERTALISYLRERDIRSQFHYVPLHSAIAGKKYGRFHGEDQWTTRESSRLVRLPMYYNMRPEDLEVVVKTIYLFYRI